MKSKLLITSVFLSLAFASSIRAEETAEVVRALGQAKSEAEMDKVVNDFDREQIRLVAELADLLEKSKNPAVKARICYLLGSIGNARATQDLIKNLLLEVAVPEQNRIHLWGAHPCQEALAKIGKPAEWRLIQLLSGTEKDEIKAAALKVIQGIEGLRGAVFVLEQAWEKAGLEERKNLTLILERARKDAP